MKRLLALLLPLAFVTVSCVYDDTEIWDELRDHEQRLLALEQAQEAANTNLETLDVIVKNLRDRVYIESVVLSDNGYIIAFSDGTRAAIVNGKDGADGVNGQNGLNGEKGDTPDIGVAMFTDGLYYWTLDGEWLLDASGNKICASSSAPVPQLKIEQETWYMSLDGGQTWTAMGPASGSGPAVFAKVEVVGDVAVFTQTDGSSFSVPVVGAAKLQILFDESAIRSIPAGESVTVDYTLIIPAGITAGLESFENNGYEVEISPSSATTGTITVSAPSPAVKGKVLFILTGSDKSQFVLTVTINGEPTHNPPQPSGAAYQKVTTLSEGRYLIVAASGNTDYAFTPISGNYGYANGTEVSVVSGAIAERHPGLEFVISVSDGVCTLAQPDGKYLYQTGSYNSFNVAAAPASGNLWNITFDSQGNASITNIEVNKYIQWSVNYNSYGSYPDAQGVLPVLYKLVSEDAGQGDGQDPGPASGPVLWSETWSGAASGDSPVSYAQSGTTVYGGASVTYSYDGGTSTKVYIDNQMDGVNSQENLLLAKTTGFWTISGIPTGGAASAILSYKVNNNSALSTKTVLSTTTEGVTIGAQTVGSETSKPFTVSYVINFGTASVIDLTISNTNASSNIRIDDIELTAVE